MLVSSQSLLHTFRWCVQADFISSSSPLNGKSNLQKGVVRLWRASKLIICASGIPTPGGLAARSRVPLRRELVGKLTQVLTELKGGWTGSGWAEKKGEERREGKEEEGREGRGEGRGWEERERPSEREVTVFFSLTSEETQGSHLHIPFLMSNRETIQGL